LSFHRNAKLGLAGRYALVSAITFFAEHGIVCRRLLTDNGFSYVKNRSLAALLVRHRIRHLTTEPYRPRTNGKVERVHQTMTRDWAYGIAYRSSRHRADALPHWLDHYNRTRPHSSIGDRPPDQPRSQRLWVGQLGRAPARWCETSTRALQLGVVTRSRGRRLIGGMSASSTSRSPSASAAAWPGSSSRWAAAEAPATTRSVRRSSRP
jgi:hypothetical protein